MTGTTWDVYLHGCLIDSVWYSATCDEDYVRRSLIEHDGYSPDIRVVAQD